MTGALDVAGRLAAGEMVIVDGGTGSQLQAEGVPMDDLAWSARANLAHPAAANRAALRPGSPACPTSGNRPCCWPGQALT